MALSLPTIFADIAKAKNKEEKKKVLLENDSVALKSLLGAAFDPNIKFLLPPGAPPYRDYQGDTNEPNPTYLYSQIRKLYLFIEGGREDLNQVKREQIFITMLEAIHPREAELLLQVKEKKIKCKGLTYNLVKDTFPNLLN
jgi:hypothetical protein